MSCGQVLPWASRMSAVVDAQVRASKLSFADVVKRLAAQNPSLPTFIAKQVSCRSLQC